MATPPPSPTPDPDLTRLLAELTGDDPDGAARLATVVYAELRALAASHLRREREDHTLPPTALVHEAYLRLSGQHGVTWRNRAHFFGIASQIMRRLLVDHARRRRARKREGGERVALADSLAVAAPGTDGTGGADALDLLALDDALARLAEREPRQARVVELRFFGGLEVEETAEALGISPATVKRDWTLARVWLRRALAAAEPATE